jgi:hypothetical protein
MCFNMLKKIKIKTRLSLIMSWLFWGLLDEEG